MQLIVLCCCDFDHFLRFVLRQDQVSSTICFADEGLQDYIAWGVAPVDVISAVARSYCK
jgi:capsule polysaccharide modification protein KpsS